MTPEVQLVLVFAVGFAVISLAYRAFDSAEFVSPLRRYFYRRDARRWAGGEAPEAVERGYWTLGDYRADSVQLRALGYRVASESSSGGFILVDHGFRGRPPLRRRIPLYFVVYERKVGPG